MRIKWQTQHFCKVFQNFLHKLYACVQVGGAMGTPHTSYFITYLSQRGVQATIHWEIISPLKL